MKLSGSMSHKKIQEHIPSMPPILKRTYINRTPMPKEGNKSPLNISKSKTIVGNKLAVSPTIYTLLKYTVLPVLKSGQQVPDRETKEIIYRNLFRNSPWQQNGKNLEQFSERFATIYKRLYPYYPNKEPKFSTLE